MFIQPHLTALSVAWMGVAATTIIFVVIAGISSMPKMGKLRTLTIGMIFLAASSVTAFGAVPASRQATAQSSVSGTMQDPLSVGDMNIKQVSAPGKPLLYNKSPRGHIVFTFDDGPGQYTPSVISELYRLNIRGVFFTIGRKVAQVPQVVRDLKAHGHLVENHTWDHKSFTGKGTGAKPLTDEQVRNELIQSSEALVAAGLPSPHYYRPPYGAVSPATGAVAAELGLRLIPDSTDDGVFIDSGDWAGLPPEQIANRVTRQMAAMLAVQDHPTMVVTFHDGIRTAPDTIKALPLIVAWMNANNVSATTTMPGVAG